MSDKKIIHIDDIGKILDDIHRFYDSGQVAGIVTVLKLKNGDTVSCWHTKTNYLELLGMCECVKADITAKAEDRI